ncbi:MAG: tetratricopeptide repeat protein [Desulfobacterales bacterium]|nr:tetratricopeptide repeat protein [Desulfobacterales bacterium]
MTQNRQELYNSRCSTRQFLFSKTDHAPQDKKKLSVGMDKLLKEFPNILIGKSFTESARTKIYPFKEFAAMAVQADLSPDSDADTGSDTDTDIKTEYLLLDVAKTIDSVCNLYYASKGIGGLIEPLVFGCLFPEKDDAFCLEIADKINESLSKIRNDTVTIGIASYPRAHFDKDQIVENALKALDHASFFGPGGATCFDAVSLNISGDRYYQKGDIYGAIEEFNSALMLEPSNVNVRNSLGVCYGVLRFYQKALKQFEAALRIDSNELMALYNTGLVNMLTDNKDKAIEYFLRAGSMGEEVFEAAFQIGRLYLKKKEFKNGKKYLEKALKLRPDSGLTCRYLGECYAGLNMPNEAIAAYKKAIKQNPYDAASLSAIGYLFDIQGENPEISTVFCKHSVELAPDNGLYRNRLGRLYLKQNRLDDALKEFIRASQLGYDSRQYIEKTEDLKLETETWKLEAG